MDDKNWHSIMLYTQVMDFFIKAYKERVLAREDFIEIETKVAEKCGLSPLSVYRIKIEDIR